MTFFKRLSLNGFFRGCSDFLRGLLKILAFLRCFFQIFLELSGFLRFFFSFLKKNAEKTRFYIVFACCFTKPARKGSKQRLCGGGQKPKKEGKS